MDEKKDKENKIKSLFPRYNMRYFLISSAVGTAVGVAIGLIAKFIK